ncbi:ABA4-like family protein [Mesorhizobium sp. YIM 152430]|uniref:ABA4-like family protein n=1 Tax=Mesorhizobium sp. YIM 152430 TaxID=3031761 RepID=UPI0023D99DE3|nr:ABA4-like family protein [Mesorhizobium sp. YIM 152430]MDF1601702.1 ABA4-like family protein [Mesorhizobium sp. YIM 152430]
MSADLIFQYATLIAVAGWATLIVSPLMPRISNLAATYAMPALISVAYAGLILAFWSRAEGGFASLDEVAQLFQTRELLLAGWLHYLAFDLFVGAWIVRTGRTDGVPFWLVLSCLPLTFLFGPAGYLAFVAIRAASLQVRAMPAIEGR